MSFYGRHLGVPSRAAAPILVQSQIATRARTLTTPAALVATASKSISPPAHLTVQTATRDQVAAVFEWYGLTVRPPGGFADNDTLVALENHISDLLNLTPSSAKIAAQQQAVANAQTAVQTAQKDFDTWLATDPNSNDFNDAVAARAAAQNTLAGAQSALGGYQAAQIGNQNTVVNLALAHSSRISQALQSSGDVPPATQTAPVSTAVSSQGATAGPVPESFMDQYGMLVLAGGAAAVMLGLGAMLLKSPTKMAGYHRRRRR